ncbi:MAG TPA: DUF6452 family protein [Prevotella sp.]
MRRLVTPLIVLLALSACSTINCPLNNVVGTYYKLGGEVKRLGGELTVTTATNNGNDTVVLNRAAAVDSFALPISYTNKEDVFTLQLVKTDGTKITDRIRVEKENYEHFESTDCSPAFFHRITGVNHTENMIESIEINNANVTYDSSKAHFIIRFKSVAQ